MAEKKKIAVCFGGRSSEHEVSCLSAAWVVENINAEKYDVIKIGISKNGRWFLYLGGVDEMRGCIWAQDKDHLVPCAILPSASRRGLFSFETKDGVLIPRSLESPDLVFPVLHGKNGEDGTIQGLLQLAGIPFVGSGAYSSALCMNKNAAKLLVRGRGIAGVADWICLKKGEYDIDEAQKWVNETALLPVFVKPACAGSSVGVTKVKSMAELGAAVEAALLHDDRALVEKAVRGREIEVAILSAGGKTYVSRCGEIDPGAEFYDYNTKYIADTAKTYIPARITESAAQTARAAAEKIYSALDCKGLARVDFFVTERGEVVFNEINTMPGMTAISLYPRLMEDIGFDGGKLVERLIESAAE